MVLYTLRLPKFLENLDLRKTGRLIEMWILWMLDTLGYLRYDLKYNLYEQWDCFFFFQLNSRAIWKLVIEYFISGLSRTARDRSTAWVSSFFLFSTNLCRVQWTNIRYIHRRKKIKEYLLYWQPQSSTVINRKQL